MSYTTPFELVHQQLGATFGNYHGWKLPSDYGDPFTEAEAIYQNSCAFDVSSFGKIAVKGTGSEKLIDKLTAAGTKELRDGTWIWSFACNENGSLVDILRIGRTGDDYLILTSPAKREEMLSLIKNCADDDIQIDDLTEETGMLGIYGPGAVEAVDGILPFDVSGIGKNGITKILVMMMSVTIIRGSWLGVDGIELLCPLFACRMAAGAVAKYHKEKNITPAGMDAMETAMAESSLPLSITAGPGGKDINPISLGLGHLVDFEKDFIGKKALQQIAEAGPDKLLVGLKTAMKGRRHCDLKIQYDDMEIGWADKMTVSPRFDCNIAMAMIDNEFFDLVDQVQVVGDNLLTAAQIAVLPFEKGIAAGIYK